MSSELACVHLGLCVRVDMCTLAFRNSRPIPSTIKDNFIVNFEKKVSSLSRQRITAVTRPVLNLATTTDMREREMQRQKGNEIWVRIRDLEKSRIGF